MALVLSGVYRRVWGRARASEFALAALALAGGLLLAAAWDALLTPSIGGRATAARWLVAVGFAVPLCIGSRAAAQIVQDAMAWVRRRSRETRGRRVLLWGAGDRCLLFLRSLSYLEPDREHRPEIVGLLDEDVNLHGRVVYGHRVLGGLAGLAAEARARRAEELIVLADVDTETRERLLAGAAQADLAVREWTPVMRTLREAAQPGGQTDGSSAA
jgi:FlaA1/EpsC-like NDP-sugar epimerase